MDRLRQRRPLPVPTHLKTAMTIQAVLGMVLIVPCVHPAWDKFGTLACFGVVAFALPVGCYGAWRVGSAESGESDPWRLDMLATVIWITVLGTAVTVVVAFLS
jgi:hypothetical protein